MSTILEIVGAAAVGVLIGGMVFFPTVVAPSVFRSLSAENAGTFLRSMFPLYYAYMIVTSAVAALALYGQPLLAAGMAGIAVSTLWVRQSLMPKINQARDDGDEKLFHRRHMISVAINMVQLAGAIWVGISLL